MDNGTYLGRGIADDAELREGANGEYVYVPIQLANGEIVEFFGSFSQTEIKDRKTGKVIGTVQDMTVKGLLALGWDGKDIGNLTMLGDRDVEVYIKNEEWDGQMRPKVKSVRKPRGKLSGASKSSLNDRLRRSVVLARSESNDTEPTKAPKPRPTGTDDDDL